jgi:cobalt-zinc-cadmium efflux system membrane fusion protein
MRAATIGKSMGFISIVSLSILVGWWIGKDVRDGASGGANENSEKSTNRDSTIVEVNAKARENMGLRSQPARLTEYWKSITIPGVIRDRPGISDRGVTSPAVGVVSAIHVFPGDTVKPGERLVTLQLFSEYLQATQTQLFKAIQETNLIKTQMDRLGGAVESGAISGTRMLELRNDLQRQQIAIQAAKQELLNRGLPAASIDSISQGNFVSQLDIVAPPYVPTQSPVPSVENARAVAVETQGDAEIPYEVHGLNVELGQTVQAGELLLGLANHQTLYVVGHAFKQDAEVLERAALNGTQVDLGFAEDAPDFWPQSQQVFTIRHLANTVDLDARTFDFFVPLQNQNRQYVKDGKAFLVWRYRPGQRVRIRIPIERLENVVVLPTEGVVKEAGEAFVFQQNGDLFKQISVQIVYQDRQHTVIANDGSITLGTFLAQNSASALKRILKSQAESGHQPGMHVHADGTVHAAH